MQGVTLTAASVWGHRYRHWKGSRLSSRPNRPHSFLRPAAVVRGALYFRAQ